MENQNNTIRLEEFATNFNLKKEAEKTVPTNQINLTFIQNRINQMKSKISNSIMPDFGDIDFNITDDDCMNELDW